MTSSPSRREALALATVAALAGDRAEVLVHGSESYLRLNYDNAGKPFFDISGAEVVVQSFLQRQAGTWTVVQTDWPGMSAYTGRTGKCDLCRQRHRSDNVKARSTVSGQGDRRVVHRRGVLRQMAGAGMLAIGGTVLVACGAGDQLAGATATNTTTVPTTAGTAASTVLGAPWVAASAAPPTATARAGPLPAVSPSTESPPAPTPQATAVALAGQAAVWETVVQATKGTIVPLLRPTVLPAGIAAVRLLRAESGLFDVEYSGPGQRLRVSVGRLNPPPGAGEARVVVRGQHVALVFHPADVPEGSDWLTWREPGRWRPFGAAPPEPFVEYFVFVQGVGPAEVQQVLTSLTPLPLPGPPATPTPASPPAGYDLPERRAMAVATAYPG